MAKIERGKTLTIIGMGKDYDPVEVPETEETWTTLSTVRKFPQLLRRKPNILIWDCHEEVPERRDPYSDWPNKVKVQVFPAIGMKFSKEGVQRKTETVMCFDIRKERELVGELIRKYGHVFSNQICWMVATAIEWQFNAITLFGISLFKEYLHEVPNLSYLLGVARGKGIGITVIGPSALMPSNLYGISPEQQSIL